MSSVISTDIIIALVVILIIMAIVIMLGKGDFLIAGYNTASKEEKEKYNIKRLRFLISAILLVSVVYAVLMIPFGQDVVGALTMTAVLVVLTFAVVILANTWAKKKKKKG